MRISAASSTVWPINPACSRNTKPPALAGGVFTEKRCFAIEHLSPAGRECRFFGDVPDARQIYVWFVVNVVSKYRESPSIVSEIGHVCMRDVRQTACAVSRTLCKSSCICDCRNLVAVWWYADCNIYSALGCPGFAKGGGPKQFDREPGAPFPNASKCVKDARIMVRARHFSLRVSKFHLF